MEIEQAKAEYRSMPEVVALFDQAAKIDSIEIPQIAQCFAGKISLRYLVEAVDAMRNAGADLDKVMRIAQHYNWVEKQQIVAELGIVAGLTGDAEDIHTLAQIAINHHEEHPPETFQRAYFFTIYHAGNPERKKELQRWFLTNSSRGNPVDNIYQFLPVPHKTSY